MVAEEHRQTYVSHLKQELDYLSLQLERAQRKETHWSLRRAMLEESVRRVEHELEELVEH